MRVPKFLSDGFKAIAAFLLLSTTVPMVGCNAPSGTANDCASAQADCADDEIKVLEGTNLPLCDVNESAICGTAKCGQYLACEGTYTGVPKFVCQKRVVENSPCVIDCNCKPGLRCANKVCVANTSPGPDGGTSTCGAQGQACCSSGQACNIGLACASSVCQPSSAPVIGQSCSADGDTGMTAASVAVHCIPAPGQGSATTLQWQRRDSLVIKCSVNVGRVRARNSSGVALGAAAASLTPSTYALVEIGSAGQAAQLLFPDVGTASYVNSCVVSYVDQASMTSYKSASLIGKVDGSSIVSFLPPGT